MRNKFIFIIIVISFIIGMGTLTRGHDWGDDFASYIMQAQSILKRQTDVFVQHNTFTVFESSTQIGPTAYPWGYPLILTPAMTLKGIHPLPLKVTGLFFFAGFLFCVFLLTKNRLTRTESLLLVSLFAFNPMLIRFLDQILSDIPFLFFSTLTLLLVLNKKERSFFNFILLGSVIAFAFFIRTQGILLLFSYITLEILQGWTHRADKKVVTKNLLNVLYVTIGFGFLWLIYSLIFPGGGESYFSQYKTFQIKTVLAFIGSYAQVFNAFFGNGFIWKYLYVALFIFFLIGMWKRRKEEQIFIIYFFIWMLLLITWPYWQGPRFIFPLLPIFIYFTFWGMKTVIARLPEKHQQKGQITFTGFWLVIVGVFLFTSVSNAYINLKEDRAINGPFDTVSTEMFTFIKENTPSDSVVIFFKPRAMRLFTDRDSIMALECDRLSLGSFVVIHKNWENSQIPPDQINECKTPLVNIFENRRFIVYQISK